MERSGDGQVLFKLSGGTETVDVRELQQLLALEASEHQLVFNVQDVTIVNQDAVECLAQCEAIGITLTHCPRDIRRWIDQLKGRLK